MILGGNGSNFDRNSAGIYLLKLKIKTLDQGVNQNTRTKPLVSLLLSLYIHHIVNFEHEIGDWENGQN